MSEGKTASRAEWLAARKALLAKEKQFTRLRDELSRERRELPRVRVEKEYRFFGEGGAQTLADLFAGKSQLIVYHFMFAPDWSEGCPACSFWADNFEGAGAHLAHRDISLAAVSRAPLEKLLAYKKRMGWTFPWVSSLGGEFNYDFGVSFSPEQLQSGGDYNFGTIQFTHGEEAPGVSVFCRDDSGGIYHTYSCYARGLDILNGAYHYMDLTPKGRDEDGLPFTMSWLRRKDQYDD